MPLRFSELWRELKDRRVVRVAIGYAVVAAVIVQAADLTFEPPGLPAWTYTFVLVLALAGFPVALGWRGSVVRRRTGARSEIGSGNWLPAEAEGPLFRRSPTAAVTPTVQT